MLPLALSLAAGLLFGAGLAISDMMNPARVLNFFDVAGSWDPTLMFVMVGALATTAIGYRIVFARGRPLLGSTFNLPTAKQIDLPLIVAPPSSELGGAWQASAPVLPLPRSSHCSRKFGYSSYPPQRAWF